jgi:hypothetical protein
MHHPHDRAGFEDSVLHSNQDFEPYGYGQARLATLEEAAQRLQPWQPAGYARDRVIEAAVLADLTRLG